MASKQPYSRPKSASLRRHKNKYHDNPERVESNGRKSKIDAFSQSSDEESVIDGAVLDIEDLLRGKEDKLSKTNSVRDNEGATQQGAPTDLFADILHPQHHYSDQASHSKKQTYFFAICVMQE